MATAAPAAAAPAAAPQAAEAAAQPAAAKPESGAQAPAKPIRPIPPRPKLPGVMEDGPEDASAPEAVAARARDAQGRFVAGEPKDTGVVAKPEPRALEAPDGEPIVPELPEAKPKYKFAGREFDSQEAAEQHFKSLAGRFDPIQKAATAREAQLVKAAESARGWHAEHGRLAAENEKLKARVAELEGGRSVEPAAPEAKGIDYGLFKEIWKIANEAGEPEKAFQYLIDQVDAQRKADFEAWRESFETPFREREAAEAEQAQLAQTADTLVESMAAHTNPDGSPAFPEFRDGEQARAVGELWQSLGLDPRLALTPGGAVAAVALYRMAKGMDAAVASAPAPVAPPPPDPAAQAAASLDGGRPLMPAAAARRDMEPSVARLVAGLKDRTLLRPGLGFEA